MKMLNDFQTSVRKALNEIDSNWEDYSGLIICGSHTPENYKELLDEIQEARENQKPFLGICAGMQLMAVEYARNVLGIKDATSEEFGTGSLVVKKMTELRVGMLPAMYDGHITLESFWHNYKVNIDSYPGLWDGFEITEVNDVVGFMKLKDRDNFFGVQFHPEYQSSAEKPHPLLVKFLNYAKMAM